jgi:hypothetical protein
MSGTIKSNYDDASRGGTLSTHSSWNTMKTTGGCAFNFSRSSSVKTPLSATLPSKFDKPRVMYATNNKEAGGSKSLIAQAAQSRSRGALRQRRNSNCSDITCDTTLPTPGKPRAHTSEGSRSLFDKRSPIAKKSSF